MDGYYMQREFNRDSERIEQIKAWCDENGKGLHMLANSGCLKDCSFQSFHDNLVAHEAGLRQRQNTLRRYPAYCWEYLTEPAHWVAILQNTWIRPEDIHHYDQWFTMAKLATRMHANPRKVVSAYARGRFSGNLLDLMEPGYGPLFAGMVFDNTRFPADWYERTTQCDKQCQRCGYCQTVLERVLIKVEDLLAMPRRG
jgi:collagenase-like PrtC family protease